MLLISSTSISISVSSVHRPWSLFWEILHRASAMVAIASGTCRSRSRSQSRRTSQHTGAPDIATQLRISTLNSCCGFGALVETPLTAESLLEDETLVERLVQAWQDFGGLLVLRGLTDMTAARLAAVSKIFGEIEPQLDDSKLQYAVDGVSSVMRLGNTRNESGELTSLFTISKVLPEDGCCRYSVEDRTPVWHTDSIYRRSPPIGSLLFCKQAPPAGGQTCFADMRAAYDELDAETSARLEGYECVCSMTHHDTKINKRSPDFPIPTAEQRAANPAVRVPMVLKHPLTGRLALYGLNSGTCEIVPKGKAIPQKRMDQYELEAVEDESVQRMWRDMLPRFTSRRFTVVWQWEVGDLVVWDNRCTIHCATGFAHDMYTREMWRTTLAADRRRKCDGT